MSSAVRKGAHSTRYMITKFLFAAEEFVHHVINPKAATTAAAADATLAGTSVLTQAVEKFREAYTKQMTMTMYIAGAAMYPSLNRRVLKEPEAVEKLVVRLLPRPSSRSVWVGDVVAFNSPLGKPSENQVMVRRVAAVEGMEMISEGEAESDADFQIPAGHCWVLSDNVDMKPPAVIDSRTFGFIPMSNILGRVIYAASSATEHSPVVNSPSAQAADEPILEQEVVLAGLFGQADKKPDTEEQK